jgi:hypothetical protein
VSKKGATGTLKSTVVQKDGTQRNIVLYNVAYVPSLSNNLLSITNSFKNGHSIPIKDKLIVHKKKINYIVMFKIVIITNARCSQEY